MKNCEKFGNLRLFTWRSSDISEEARSASVDSFAASKTFCSPWGGEGTVESGLGCWVIMGLFTLRGSYIGCMEGFDSMAIYHDRPNT